MSHRQKRRQIAEVVARRAASALAAPYRSDISDWQNEFALLRIHKSSSRYSEDEQIAARLELGELLAAVQHRRVEFALAMKDHPITGALADLDNSLTRLTNELRAELLS